MSVYFIQEAHSTEDNTYDWSLRPDSSKHKLQINFCFLNAKYYIWLCRQEKCSPKLIDFLLYLKHIYEMKNKKETKETKQQQQQQQKIQL